MIESRRALKSTVGEALIMTFNPASNVDSILTLFETIYANTCILTLFEKVTQKVPLKSIERRTTIHVSTLLASSSI